jgi:uncharacterized protein (DUF924 family)
MAQDPAVTAAQVTDFWLSECSPSDWYRGDPEFDAQCSARFGSALADLKAGLLQSWRSAPDTTLAYLLLADQLSRNIHRGTAEAFASDALARAAAKQAIALDWDRRIAEPQRQFFYMPLVHSEYLEDQDRAVRLLVQRMPETGADNLLHARAHREVIRKFGRFPARNVALGRKSSGAEMAYLESNGYSALLEALSGGPSEAV